MTERETAAAPISAIMAAVLPFAALAGLGWLQLCRGSVFYDRWVQDMFIPLEAVLHLLRGDRAHVDFQSPLGLFYLLPFRAAAALAPVSARTIVYANLIAGTAAALLAWAVAWGRLGRWGGALLAIYAAFVAASPRQPGDLWDGITYNAAYNRFGWALIGLLAMAAMLPRRVGRGDGVLAGLLLCLLFHLKITYFLAGVGVAGLAWLAVRRGARLSFALGGLLGFALPMVAIEAVTGSLLPYLADLRAAAAAQADPARLWQFVAVAQSAMPGFSMVVVIAMLAEGERRLTAGLARRLALPVALIACGVAIGTQNYFAAENPLLPLAGLLCFAAGQGWTEVPPWRHRAALAAVGLLFLRPIALDTAAAACTALRPSDTGPEVVWLATTPLADLRIAPGEVRLSSAPADALPGVGNDAEYFLVLGDGVDLLRRHAAPGQAVLPLAWSNPFPLLLGTRPPPHELLWWDAGRTFSAKTRPDPALLLAGVDHVLVPKTYYDLPTSAAMIEIYADAIKAGFVLRAESRYWSLWSRK